MFDNTVGALCIHLKQKMKILERIKGKSFSEFMF